MSMQQPPNWPPLQTPAPGQFPTPEPPRPAVWPWYVAYCVFMAVLYLLVAVFGLVLASGALPIEPEKARELALAGWIYTCCGLPLGIPFAVAPFLPRRKWAWIVHLVLICVGMTSCACLPATIPLLIFWIKPEVRAWFGRTP